MGPLIAEIDLAAIVHNCRVLRALVPTQCRLCVAAKADAYGHGLANVLPAFEEAGVEMLAVAAIAEAERARQLGWGGDVLLLGSELSIYRGADKARQAAKLVAQRVSTTVSTLDDLAALDAAGQRAGLTASVQIMLDTGMTREGIYANEAHGLLEAAGKCASVSVDGLYTHMAAADEADKSFTLKQLGAFQDVVAALRSRGTRVPPLHAANSPAAIDVPELHFDMIRLGVSVYGCQASPAMQTRPDLRQVLRLRSFVTQVKRVASGAVVGYGCTFKAPEAMDVGIVPIGYADGYDRRLSNRGSMSLAGVQLPVIGRVSMDQVTLDLRPLARAGRSAAVGDEVIVIDDDPVSANNIESLAQLLDTVPHEVMTGLGGRIRRVPVRNP